jgi:hypothetical protein
MKALRSLLLLLTLVSSALLISACTPEVGTDAWCDYMKEKPKGDWTANELGDFSKHCIL